MNNNQGLYNQAKFKLSKLLLFKYNLSKLFSNKLDKIKEKKCNKTKKNDVILQKKTMRNIQTNFPLY